MISTILSTILVWSATVIIFGGIIAIGIAAIWFGTKGFVEEHEFIYLFLIVIGSFILLGFMTALFKAIGL